MQGEKKLSHYHRNSNVHKCVTQHIADGFAKLQTQLTAELWGFESLKKKKKLNLSGCRLYV
jgi:hypothetical protein